MTRAWACLVALLGVQAAISGLAATLEWTYSCSACRAGGLSLGLVGFAFYGGLFICALAAGPSRLLFGSLFFGFGIHAMLMVQLVSMGRMCTICLSAAVVSSIITALAIRCDRANLVRLAGILPWSALLVLGWNGATTRAPSSPEPSVRGVTLVVYTQSECPYCEAFRSELLPRARREFRDRIHIQYRPASASASVRLTPTILVVGEDRRSPSRVFEGLPSWTDLRRAILEAEVRS